MIQVILSGIFIYLPLFSSQVNAEYLAYHKEVSKAEILITQERYEDALETYKHLFASYDFIFLRDLKVASQLAFHTNDHETAFVFVRRGITNGWEWNEIKKTNYFDQYKELSEWASIEETYDSLRASYLSTIDATLREQVHTMYRKDQKKALGALFRIGDKAQEKYANKKFVPHSIEQLAELEQIMESKGYPGEKLIGNDYWMSTILSHHNSISEDYAKVDTLYASIRPGLLRALENGEMSPYEFAMIDDWQLAVSSGRAVPGYGFLEPPRQSSIDKTNALRTAIGLRTIETRNKLVEVENKTGMDFFLPDWVKGKITVEQ